jgi:hypothetical protein
MGREISTEATEGAWKASAWKAASAASAAWQGTKEKPTSLRRLNLITLRNCPRRQTHGWFLSRAGREPRTSALVRPRFPSSFPAVLDEWRCTMREEFASTTFLAVTVAGLVLLLSGLVAFAFD